MSKEAEQFRIKWYNTPGKEVVVPSEIMQAYADKKLKECIDYIENDAEILIPINKLLNPDGSHITKKEYGLVLLEVLIKELRENFQNNRKTNNNE